VCAGALVIMSAQDGVDPREVVERLAACVVTEP
jgi:hypothetical protein